MKLHNCLKGGFKHEFTEHYLRAWERVPEPLREALIKAYERIADVQELEGWAAADARTDLEAALELAADALERHPSTQNATGNPRWFRLMALAAAEARRDRCIACFRRMGQLELIPVDPTAPQDAPPPPPRAPLPAPAAPPPARPAPTPPARLSAPAKPPKGPVLPTPDAAKLAREAIERMKARR